MILKIYNKYTNRGDYFERQQRLFRKTTRCKS